MTNKYLTYTEYQTLGGTLEEIPFQRLEYRAELKVDKYTFNRFRSLEEDESYPQELKMCVFDMIPLFEDSDSSIISESVGNYSITRKSKEEFENTAIDIIKDYLSNVAVKNVPVLYCGADEN